MGTKKSESPRTRQTYRVDRAFVEDGVYYTGSDVPQIGDLPAATIKDRTERGYIRPYLAHVQDPAPVTTVNTAKED